MLCGTCRYQKCLKKNLNAPRPSEHPPVRGKNLWMVERNYNTCTADKDKISRKYPPSGLRIERKPSERMCIPCDHPLCGVCVFFPFILDIKFVGRSSRGHTGGRSHKIYHAPSFCGACLSFSREKDSAIPFPRRPWSRILYTKDLIVLHPSGIFSFSF